MTDHRIGRLMVTCEIFFTFKTNDYLMYLEFHSIASKNKISKLVMNKEDIKKHVIPDLLSVLFNKTIVMNVLGEFLSRIRFERSNLYFKPAVLHARNKIESFVFANKLRGSTESLCWLEKRHQEQQIVGQYTKKFDKTFVVMTVFKVINLNGYEVEVYVPRVQKRFFFQIFNEEVLEIDSKTVQQIYQAAASEIKTLAEVSKGDYKKVKEGIFEIIVKFFD